MQRTIIVTGGGTGIGRACASRFAASGDRVIITGRRTAVLEQAAVEIDGHVEPVTLDSTVPEQIESFATSIGAVDVLVNNAGGNTDFQHPAPTTLKEIAAAWRTNLDANLISAVLMTRGLIPTMPDGGRVVSIGSIAADKGAESYGAAKAAVSSWNIGLARELGVRGITANVVSPGYIAETEFFGSHLTEERRRTLIEAAMTKRAGNPGDIAETVWFLSSPEASQITGQTISVNGGEQPTR